MRWGRRILGWVWVASVAASTLLFVAAVGMWGRSYWRDDAVDFRWNFQGGRRDLSANSTNGSVFFSYREIEGGHSLYSWVANSRPTSPRYFLRPDTFAGFDYEVWNFVQPARDQSVTIAVPHYFISTFCLPLPLIAIRRWRKKRRIAREGLCPVCGYDLRASVERCPECGTAIDTKHAVT